MMLELKLSELWSLVVRKFKISIDNNFLLMKTHNLKPVFRFRIS